MYRGGDVEGSFRKLAELVNNPGTKYHIGGQVMEEIAVQYEAEKQYVKAAAGYKAATKAYIDNIDLKKAQCSADAAMKSAKLTSDPIAAQNAAAAYDIIGAKRVLNGSVRAAAYTSAAGVWTSIGDHMQASNIYEKAAEAFVDAKMHAEAISSYRQMADAASKSGQGTRIRDSILPVVLKVRDDMQLQSAEKSISLPMQEDIQAIEALLSNCVKRS